MSYANTANSFKPLIMCSKAKKLRVAIPKIINLKTLFMNKKIYSLIATLFTILSSISCTHGARDFDKGGNIIGVDLDTIQFQPSVNDLFKYIKINTTYYLRNKTNFLFLTERGILLRQ